VPCLVIAQDQWRLNNGQGLSAIAPTVLQLMGINQPHEMTGKSLLLDKIKLD
jgi:2,3-bisphosphoglycerate-independent phosphoglycerate mutase